MTYENAQARERTQVLMDIANQRSGLVVGTGDLSELALGWATYNGDHMSMYGVNASIPKTLVRHLVRYAAVPVGDEALAQRAARISWIPRSAQSCCPPSRTATSPRKPKSWSAPTSCTISSLSLLSAAAVRPPKIYRLAVLRLCRHATTRDAILQVAAHLLAAAFSAQQFKRSLPAGRPARSARSPFPLAGTGECPAMLRAALWLRELEDLQ